MFVKEFVEQWDLTEDALTWLMIYESLQKQRYLYNRLPIPKSNWANTVLPKLFDDRFRKILCMDRLSFKYVTSIFYNNSNIPQTPIHAQLHYALYKFCSDGYFSPGEYLLGDAAYSNTSYLIGPCKSPYTGEKSNRRFNRKLSSVLYVHVDIEHAFGMLKG